MNKKKLLKLSIVNVLIILLLFLLLEITVRLLFPQIHLSGSSSALFKDSVYFNSAGLVPNSIGTSYGVKKEVNSNGFWKYNNSSPSIDKKKKWLFLGDSITMGIGVDNDSTFPGIINSEIDNVEILNSAMIGYSSLDYLNIVKKLIQKDGNVIGVQKIFIFWCLNDIYDFYPTSNSPDYREKGILGKVVKFLSANLKTWQLLKELFSDRQRDYFLYDYQFYEYSNPLFNKSIANIEKCASIARLNNIDISVIILPYEYQIRNFNKKELFLPQQLFQKKFESIGIKIYDILKDLKPYMNNSKSLYLFGDGIHFSEQGHKLISKILLTRFLN
ncbi:MAG: SGNH/GDSL hydrolase family protein [Ignavibacteriales bacterium]|nr:SGNH/GDSL hydrolase family protein [Ignavibacteriales bacterium]